MKKEICMIVFIIILVVVGNLITQSCTRKFLDDSGKDLQKLEKEILDGNEDSEYLKQEIFEIQKKWQDKYEVLAYYIEHDELEKIETQITLISASIEVQEFGDAVEEMEECLFLMEHIKEKEAFKLVNIF